MYLFIFVTDGVPYSLRDLYTYSHSGSGSLGTRLPGGRSGVRVIREEEAVVVGDRSDPSKMASKTVYKMSFVPRGVGKLSLHGRRQIIFFSLGVLLTFTTHN